MTGLCPPKVMSATNTRERILTMGGPNAGKTFNYFTIARLALATGSDAHFFVIDTDETAMRTLIDPGFTSLWNDDSTLKNITIVNVAGWEELLAALETVQGRLVKGKYIPGTGMMRDQDWLMIDMLSPTWGWVTDWYTRRVFDKGTDEFFLQQREKMKEGDKKMQGLEGWKDYGIINPAYAVLQDRILRTPGHIYCTAEVKQISDQADKETRLMFGPYGVIPVGQKRTPHLFSTILWQSEPRSEVREVITIKDRSRPVLQGERINDFAVDYLCGVAAWELGVPPKPKLSMEEIIAKAKAKKAESEAMEAVADAA